MITIATDINAAQDAKRDSYHNALEDFKDQERWVLCTLKYFGETTALSISRILGDKMLLTSIRRCLTYLKERNCVETTGKVKETYGAPNAVYRITKAGTDFLYGRES